MKKEIKEWWDNNKQKVYVVGGVALAIGGGYFFFKRKKPIPVKLPDNLTEAEKKYNATVKAIDERVFTVLAPALEDLILEEGVDEDIVYDVITVPFAKHGDFAEGLYEVQKEVSICVKDITMP